MPIPKKTETINRTTAKERVYTILQQWIVDGTLEPGEIGRASCRERV